MSLASWGLVPGENDPKRGEGFMSPLIVLFKCSINPAFLFLYLFLNSFFITCTYLAKIMDTNTDHLTLPCSCIGWKTHQLHNQSPWSNTTCFTRLGALPEQPLIALQHFHSNSSLNSFTVSSIGYYCLTTVCLHF